MMYHTKIEEDYITRNLLNIKERLPFDVSGVTYKQLSLFDTISFPQESVWRMAGSQESMRRMVSS